jgi:hypothetical protein
MVDSPVLGVRPAGIVTLRGLDPFYRIRSALLWYLNGRMVFPVHIKARRISVERVIIRGLKCFSADTIKNKSRLAAS